MSENDADVVRSQRKSGKKRVSFSDEGSFVPPRTRMTLELPEKRRLALEKKKSALEMYLDDVAVGDYCLWDRCDLLDVMPPTPEEHEVAKGSAVMALSG